MPVAAPQYLNILTMNQASSSNSQRQYHGSSGSISSRPHSQLPLPNSERSGYPTPLFQTDASVSPFTYDAAEHFSYGPHVQWRPQQYRPLTEPTANPYPTHPPALQAPPVAHKVWILDCKSCGTFLTNRGMKAVLLLRPNVSLFSTDALPINCSAYCADEDLLRPSTACNASAQSPRTCECLTQTLLCHGCATGVGYMIVIPCARCTTSITANNRATNGHRFVFHSTEIVSSERHYIDGEPGVIATQVPPQPTVPVSYPPPGSVSPYRGPSPTNRVNLSWHAYFPSSPTIIRAEGSSSRSSSPAPSSTSTSPSLPDLIPAYDNDTGSYVTRASNGSSSHTLHQYQLLPQYYHDTHLQHTSTRSNLAPYTFSPQASPPFEPKPTEFGGRPQESCVLKAGDVLFWHHLRRHGEIPGVTEDPRARFGRDSESSSSTETGMVTASAGTTFGI